MRTSRARDEFSIHLRQTEDFRSLAHEDGVFLFINLHLLHGERDIKTDGYENTLSNLYQWIFPGF